MADIRTLASGNPCVHGEREAASKTRGSLTSIHRHRSLNALERGGIYSAPLQLRGTARNDALKVDIQVSPVAQTMLAGQACWDAEKACWAGRILRDSARAESSPRRGDRAQSKGGWVAMVARR